MIIAIYVDDVILASNDVEILKEEKSKLSSYFEMADRVEMSFCFGMSIKRDREAKVLTINQKAYLESILNRFGMSDYKPVSTPMEAGKKFEK